MRPCLVALAMLAHASLLAGPPLITDDPGMPPKHGWEVNVANLMAGSKGELVMDVARFDINYGLSDNSQLRVEFPVRFVDCQEGNGWGLGDLALGWKRRLWDEAEREWTVSCYPQLLAPTGRECLEIGDGETVFFLPFEAGKHFLDDKLFVYGEVGYAVVFDDPRCNTWKFGLAAEWRATEKLEWLFEVGAFTCPLDLDSDEPFFNGGFRFHVNPRVALMASAGRSFVDGRQGTHEFMSYVGLQFTWGGRGQEETAEDAPAKRLVKMIGKPSSDVTSGRNDRED